MGRRRATTLADLEAREFLRTGAPGAVFLTPPIDRKAELRCYIRDPDGDLIEVRQASGMRHDVFADPPAGTGDQDM